MSKTAGNVGAFLDMLGWSEGTTRVAGSDDGYNVLVGGKLFHSYDDHPRESVYLKNLNIFSTAAGRYQLLARYYNHYRDQLGLKDFSPESQDAIAIQQIKECGAYGWAERGDLDYAIPKVRNIWASLPDAGYKQHENTHEQLVAAFLSAGGRLVS